ncbi:unnamed protein product [Polarella glacialis]|uniref:Uncharacterized protein n=1 Tax=Polarella glacialis TaxID=89957 RepID=A0A813LXK2_POLGL|nr:unnamed protein product [Polarella glacialis]|mmetsp:Transcript_16245/g.25962  ORF Transcript_16245/g.25962 Transcript_16245/m.25962 type:complete len:144 (+) Transcript_16245:74-505(+)
MTNLSLMRLCLVAVLAMPAAAKMECTGGSVGVCQCLLGCKVFGGDATQCVGAEDPNAVVDRAVREAMIKKNTECSGISCVVKCASDLECLDAAVVARCLNVKSMKEDSKTPCKVECAAAFRGSGLPGAALAGLFAIVVATIGA